MANPHFQNMILWAGNTDATEYKKDQPMFQPYPSDQTFYGYFKTESIPFYFILWK